MSFTFCSAVWRERFSAPHLFLCMCELVVVSADMWSWVSPLCWKIHTLCDVGAGLPAFIELGPISWQWTQWHLHLLVISRYFLLASDTWWQLLQNAWTELPHLCQLGSSLLLNICKNKVRWGCYMLLEPSGHQHKCSKCSQDYNDRPSHDCWQRRSPFLHVSNRDLAPCFLLLWCPFPQGLEFFPLCNTRCTRIDWAWSLEPAGHYNACRLTSFYVQQFFIR